MVWTCKTIAATAFVGEAETTLQIASTTWFFREKLVSLKHYEQYQEKEQYSRYYYYN